MIRQNNQRLVAYWVSEVVKILFYPEDGESNFLQNVGNYQTIFQKTV
jgi:hypothetical protein